MKGKKNGSALVWAMAVIMLMVILITSVLSVAMAYLGGSLRANQQKQAYLTALSAIHVLADQLNDSENKTSFLPKKYGPSGTVKVPSVGMHEGMGTCSAELTRTQEEVSGKKEDRITITTMAKVGEQSYSMRAILALTSDSTGSGTPEEPEEPKEDHYFSSGFYFTDVSQNSNNIIYAPFTTQKGMDLYYDNQTGEGLTFYAADDGEDILLDGNVISSQPLKFDTDSKNSITVNGNVICGSRSTNAAAISAQPVEINGQVYINGNVYSRGKIQISGGAVVQGDLIADSIQFVNPNNIHISGQIRTKSGKVQIGWPGTPGYQMTSEIKLQNGQTVQVGKIDATPNVLPEVSLKSYPASSQISNAKTLNNAGLDKGLQGGSTYVVSGGTVGSPDKPLKVSGTGDVIVYIPKGQTLQFETLEDTAALPRVYFIMEDERTSRLSIHMGKAGEGAGTEVSCGAHIVGTGQVAVGPDTAFYGSCILKNGGFQPGKRVRMIYTQPTVERLSPIIKPTDLTDDGIFGGATQEEEETGTFFPGIYDKHPDATLQRVTLDCDYFYGSKEQHEFGGVTFGRNVYSLGPLRLRGNTVKGKLTSDGALELENNNTFEGAVYTTGKLTTNGANVFKGGVTAKEIDFGDSKQEIQGEIHTESGKVTYTDRMTGKRTETSNYYGTPVSKLTEPLVSKAPAYTPPSVAKPTAGATELTKAMVANSRKAPLGDPGAKDTYYQISKGVNSSGGDLYVQGTGNIFIFIDDTDFVTKFDSIQNIDGKNEKSQVYLILGNNAMLYFNGADSSPYYAHILGAGRDVKLKGKIYGSVTTSASLQWMGSNTEVHYAPSDIIQGGTGGEEPGPDGDTPGDLWKIIHYEKGDAS